MPTYSVSLPQRRGGESVRGKLRDKRAEMRRGNSKRELLERRRPNRRENRSMALLNLQLDQEDNLLDEDDEVVAKKAIK